MRTAIAFHPDQIERRKGRRSRLMVPPLPIPEDQIDVARGQGWIVLGADSDVYPEPPIDVPAQSNPRRAPERPTDYGEA